MLATSRGLKDRLIGNSEIWLCRLRRLLHPVSPGMLPTLPAIPAVLFIAVGLLANVLRLDRLNFSSTGEHLWSSDYFNNLLGLVFGPGLIGLLAEIIRL